MDHSVITARDVSVVMGGATLLRSLDLSVRLGETVGVFGTAGSGKSVLLSLLAGLLASETGELSVLGDRPTASAVRAALSYIPSEPSLPSDMTVDGLLDFYGRVFSDFDGDAARERISALKVKRDKRFGDFSLPTKKKVQLILGLSRRARLYLVDEPLCGDAAARAYALSLLLSVPSPENALLVTASEPSELASHVDRYLFLLRGEAVAKGATADVTSLSEEFRRLTQ